MQQIFRLYLKFVNCIISCRDGRASLAPPLSLLTSRLSAEQMLK